MRSRKLAISVALNAVLTTVCLADQAAAQNSRSASIQASVMIEGLSITVVAVNDLLFGTHFASAGAVRQQQAGQWIVEANTPSTVDLTISLLPSELSDGAGHSVPLSYGSQSLFAECVFDAIAVASPTVGIAACPISGPSEVLLGHSPSAEGSVVVDLAGAPPGTYTATIELTATIR
jgi:hypothetical protein